MPWGVFSSCSAICMTAISFALSRSMILRRVPSFIRSIALRSRITLIARTALWLSESISQFGSQFTGLALPFTAIICLKAGAAELGWLAFIGSLPWLLLGLVTGVWVDRHRKQRIMVSSNLMRGTLLATIPIVAFTGLLARLGLFFLYGLSFAIGVLQVFFDVSYQSYLPSLVDRSQLVERKSKLEASRATAQAAGPSIAGFVIRIVTAPISIIFSAISFFGSALALNRIRKEDTIPEPH